MQSGCDPTKVCFYFFYEYTERKYRSRITAKFFIRTTLELRSTLLCVMLSLLYTHY